MGTMPAAANTPEQPPLLGRAMGAESRPTSLETGRKVMRAPASRDRDDGAGDARGSGDDVPVEMVETASWAGATDAERREWLRSGVVPVDYPGPVAADWPELVGIVEEKVKGTRGSHSTAPWWQFERLRSELYAAIDGLDRVLVINCGATPHSALAFLPAEMMFANTLAVFAFDTHAAFCTVQSRPHEIWARFFSSSMKDDLRYTPSDCFETFPFPDGWETHPSLEETGRTYHEHRAALMVRNNQGMTKTYNRFHDPYEDDSDIDRLRELHAAMDRAVLDAYGWTDIPTDCDFLLDYEIDEATWGRKKKPYRYRWPDAVRDEVLARLLALNAERAAEEARSGAASHTTRRKSTLDPASSRYRQTPASRPRLKVAEPRPLWPSSDE